MAIHMGNIIHERVGQRGLKARYIADFVNISESSLYKIYKRVSIDVDKLIKFSQLLDTNLFLYYMNDEPLKSMFGKQVLLLQNQVNDHIDNSKQKDEKIKNLMEMVEMQKKVIQLHEEKLPKSRK